MSGGGCRDISRMTGKTRTRQHVRKYRDLIQVTHEVMEKAAAYTRAAKGLLDGLDPMQAALVSRLVSEIEEFGRLGQRVVDQARHRIMGGEQVPVEEKLFSLFEPHTDLIVRGKTRTPVEFGHKVLIVESSYGLITDYRVLKGNPPDQNHMGPTFDHHQERFGAPPDLLASDRGFDSADNIAPSRRPASSNAFPNAVVRKLLSLRPTRRAAP